MNWPPKYESRIVEILGAQFQNGQLKLSLSFDTEEEAKQHLNHIRQIQKELRVVKKELSVEMRLIRANQKSQMMDVEANHTQFWWGRRAAKREMAEKREQLRREQTDELIPYSNVELTIDDMLVTFDGAKIKLNEWIEANP